MNEDKDNMDEGKGNMDEDEDDMDRNIYYIPTLFKMVPVVVLLRAAWCGVLLSGCSHSSQIHSFYLPSCSQTSTVQIYYGIWGKQCWRNTQNCIYPNF
jgi:hypothetical protein